MTSFGFRIASQTEATKIGKTIITDTIIVQYNDDGSETQPITMSIVNAIGTRLRLRLSIIFHRDNPEIGFLYKRLPLPGTNGKTQAKICQSPLTQRELRFISVLYVVGYFSKSCTS